MHNGLGAGHCRVDLAGVGQVCGHAAAAGRGGTSDIDTGYRVAAADEVGHHVATDAAAAAGYEDIHGVSPRLG